MKSLLSINYIFWLILSSVFYAVGEFLSKKFALQPRPVFFVCILVSYTLCALAWLPAIMQRNQFSIVGAMWSVISLLATVSIGVIIFSEKLSPVGIIGLILAAISIALLSLA